MVKPLMGYRSHGVMFVKLLSEVNMWEITSEKKKSSINVSVNDLAQNLFDVMHVADDYGVNWWEYEWGKKTWVNIDYRKKEESNF